MTTSVRAHARILIPISLGTALSLLGDAALYTVLPTHTAQAGVTLASVGILLSANRWIRLLSNGPTGVAYARWQRRPLFVASLFAGNRLVIAGFLMATFSLHLSEMLGESVTVAGVSLGVTTLTGTMLGLNALVSMVAAPILGNLSDRMGDRWRTTAGGLFIGSAGFGLLALAPPLLALWGMPLTAVASGGNQGLATTLTGDQGSANRSQRLGWLFTSGDLASAAGPPIAFALLPLIGLRALYLLAGGLFLALFFMSLVQSRRQQQSVPTASHDG